jgi:hypothetical protein
MKFIFSFFLALTLLISPEFSHSKLLQAGELGLLHSTKLKAKGIESIETLPGPNGGTYVRLLNRHGNVVSQILTTSASHSELKQFRPSKIHEYLHRLKTNGGQITKAKLKAFPLEAFAFFMAIGAVTSAELVFNYAKNPVGMDQFIDMQMDPIGQVAFAAFIVANGLAAEPLMMMTQNKLLRFFIPYLGMTVGLTASNLVHEIGHFPHLMECAFKRENCDKAYDAWLDYNMRDKFKHEWTPALVSMLVSAVLSTAIEIGIRATGAQVARLVGVQMLFAMTPGGWVAQGGRWVYKITQLAGFVYLDHLIYEPVNEALQNSFGLGPDLKESSHDLMLAIEKKTTLDNIGKNPNTTLCPTDRLKRSGEQCTEDFANKVFAFDKRLQEWQEFNFMPVTMAHQNWIQYLSQLAQRYNQSKIFYSGFLDQIVKARDFVRQRSQDSIILSKGWLYGVYVKRASGEKAIPSSGEILTTPEKIQKDQEDYLKKMLPEFFFSKKIKEQEASLTSFEQKIYKEVKKNLLSSEIEKMSQAISDIRWYLKKDIVPYKKDPIQSARLVRLFQQLFSEIGQNPEPLRAPGELYFKWRDLADSQAETSSNDQTDSQAETSSSENALGVLPGTPHYFFKQMLFGPKPDDKTNLIKFNYSGFPAEFVSPRVIPQMSFNSYLPNHFQTEPLHAHGKLNYFNLKTRGQDLGNSFEYLTIRDSLVRDLLKYDSDQNKVLSNFTNWWETHVDEQIRQALEIYSSKYQYILKLLVKHTVNQKDSSINRSTFSNNLLQSTLQALDIYLALSYPSTQRVTRSRMPIQDWATLSLDPSKTPEEIKELKESLKYISETATDLVQKPRAEEAQNFIGFLDDWSWKYNSFLDSQETFSDRKKEILKTAVTAQISRVKMWVEITQSLDFKTFVGGKPQGIPSTEKRCPPGGGSNILFRGNCQ